MDKKDMLSFKKLEGGKREECQSELLSVIDSGDMRTSGKSKIISYDGVKKIASSCRISIKETPLLVCSPTDANMQQHIWGMRIGFAHDPDRDNRVFSEGEASKMNTGKTEKLPSGETKLREWGHVDAMYRSAMAYKRAYIRGVLRLVNLTGFYGADESPAFSKFAQKTTGETQEIDYTSL